MTQASARVLSAILDVLDHEGDIMLHCRAERGATGDWIGHCEALKITVQAETWAELQEAMNEGITLMMLDLLETEYAEGVRGFDE